MARKKRGRNLCGLILLDKPKGLSSNQAMQKVRRLLDAQKAGHGGALDPMAQGVLPILFGDATRLSQRALDGDKTYLFGMQFGARTDTGDAEGQVVETSEAPAPSVEQIRALIPRFLGEQQQLPPMYSALKRDGQPLYKLARKGQVVEREPRGITIHELEFIRAEERRVWMKATVSKGTYIRTLAEDIARALGHCEHLFYLRRTIAAGLSQPLLTLEQIAAMELPERDAQLQAVDVLLPDWQPVCIGMADVHHIQHGQPVADPSGVQAEDGEERLLLDNQARAIGIGRWRDGQWWPARVFAADAISPPCTQAWNRL